MAYRTVEVSVDIDDVLDELDDDELIEILVKRLGRKPARQPGSGADDVITAMEAIRAYVERVGKLHEERKGLGDDIADEYEAAMGAE